MKETRIERIIPVPWADATTAFWCKYPSEDLSHVKDAWVLSRKIDASHRMLSTRLICIEQDVPEVLKRFSGGNESTFALETSEADPISKILRLETKNLTFGSQVKCDETCIYSATDDGKATKYTWIFKCRVERRIPFVSDKIEEALVDRASSNAELGIEKMEQLCLQVHERRQNPNSIRFIRWDTQVFPESVIEMLDDFLLGGSSHVPRRRYWLFGPRKSLSKSSWNPFATKVRTRDDS